MAHSYDLLLQAAQPGEVAPIEALVVALTARGAVLEPSGAGTWRLPDGEVAVTALREEGQVRGLDVRVPFSDKTALLESVVKALLEVAEAVPARLTDPQRADLVSLASIGGVVDEYLRMARYAGEYGGVSEALGLSTWAAPPEEGGGSTRWLLALAVFLAALYGAYSFVIAQQRPSAPDEAPGAVHGPPKVRGK